MVLEAGTDWWNYNFLKFCDTINDVVQHKSYESIEGFVGIEGGDLIDFVDNPEVV